VSPRAKAGRGGGARKPGRARARRATRATARVAGAPGRARAAPPAKRAAAAGASTRKGAKRGGLALVPKAARRPPTTPAFPQTEGASSKQLVMFRLLKARAQVLAAIQGLAAGVAERPLGEGRWNVRQIVLHLCSRDRARLREFEAALRGVPVSWQDLDDEEMARLNASEVGSIAHLGWDEALRLLHSTRQALIEAIEGVPDEPVEVWGPGHPFGWMLHALPAHDEHHAATIKQWRAESGA
jgi:hypothetical protein